MSLSSLSSNCGHTALTEIADNESWSCLIFLWIVHLFCHLPFFKPISTPILASYHISIIHALMLYVQSYLHLSLFRSLAVYVSHVAKQKLDWDKCFLDFPSGVSRYTTKHSVPTWHSRDETINTCLGLLKCFPHSDNAQTHPVKKCLRRGSAAGWGSSVNVKAVQQH